MPTEIETYWCLPVVPPSVLVVTVLFLDVSVGCEVVFSDSDCEFIVPQTSSLSRSPEASAVLESETKPVMEVEYTNPPWTARERLLIDKMEQYLEESGSIQVEVTELEHDLLGPEDADICIKSYAEGARDESGARKLVLLDAEEGGLGAEVADAVRFFNGADLRTAQDCSELRQQEENDAEYPELIPEFDAVYAWTSRDRVVVNRMTAYLARKRLNVLVEMKDESDRNGRRHWSLGLECM